MSAEVREFLRRLDGVVLPWQQAAEVRFDLAIAAARPSLERLHAPVLTVSHGIGDAIVTRVVFALVSGVYAGGRTSV
jgi:hypothetical protein